jgi:hypothetical protein
MRTAVYVLKRGDTPFYIGKSIDPYSRWLGHRDKLGDDIIMEILKEFNDPEFELIKEYSKKGIILENKITRGQMLKNWSVGDILQKP